ncbi:Mpp10 protein [Ascobolus immersus RN42]|uniref:U3 small nucleolar ribonucleoprotein protein MPP10 n=1 Tax=Ascobolus immersus RN42 TaxID=1160509 RepID=A0A3N4II93_ASCIM|nr:Mpp10 protein [Ascobolus immersus RN42]
MAADSNSIDSHTSSTLSAHAITSSLATTPSLTLLRTSLTSPHIFLSPSNTDSLHSASLSAAKQFLDPVAATLAHAPQNKRRKTNNDGGVLLDQVYVEGFDVDQVWEQVKGLVDRVYEGCKEFAEPKQVVEDSVFPSEDEEDDSEGNSDEDDEDLSGSEGEQLSDDEEELDGEELDGEASEDEEGDEDAGFGNDDDEEEEDVDSELEEGGGTYVKDVHGLNDGFFSIDDFNRITEEFEQMDQQGIMPSDDEDGEPLDFTADPSELSVMPTKDKKGKKHAKDDAEEDEEHDDYEDSDEGEANGDNANDLMYDDFFLPPPKPAGKGKKNRGWAQDEREASRKEPKYENDMERIEADMARVRRDLFDSLSPEPEDEKQVMGSGPKLSTFQKQQTALTQQIRQLEQAAIAKKQWTLAGEAKGRDRPQNSLLEEDLDFERVSKPVPVITQTVTESLEEMIKGRILAGNFDDLPRRRPDEHLLSSSARRGRVELDDTKATEGLADIYEREHAEGQGAKTKAEQALEKDHAEITELFKTVMYKLDSLTSYHYTPKPATESLTIVSDTAVIAMEDAQPTAASADLTTSRLAPQEVYDPRKDSSERAKGEGKSGELVLKSGAPLSRAEMSTEDKKKLRKRMKEQEKKKKAAEGKSHGKNNVKEGSRKDVEDTLRKGGVTIIGKGGEKRDLDGKEVREKRGRSGASGIKL